MHALEVMLLVKRGRNETVQCNAGEKKGRGQVTCEAKRRGGGEGNAGEEGTGWGSGKVTKPIGDHAQQNSKNSEQNEANDQQRQDRKDNRQTQESATWVLHIPQGRSHVGPD